jgi:diaminopimelate epimerase
LRENIGSFLRDGEAMACTTREKGRFGPYSAGPAADTVMSALSNRRFLKMNGLGNEIVVVDLRGTKLPVSPEEARAVAADARSRFDQLMAIHDPRTPGTDAYLRIYNTDGSESGTCGNGTRCVAWALREDPMMGRPGEGPLLFETKAGLLPVSRDGERTFTVDMGRPRLRWDEIPLRDPFQDTRYIELQIGPIDDPILHSPSVVSVGNPHAIFWVDDVNAYDLGRIGPMLENHPIFPERANISLAEVPAPDRIVLRVWERGAGLTRACGSAACAALVAAARKKLTGRKATVTLPGGDLVIEWRADDHVLMTGPVELEWEGVFAPSLFAGAA